MRQPEPRTWSPLTVKMTAMSQVALAGTSWILGLNGSTWADAAHSVSADDWPQPRVGSEHAEARLSRPACRAGSTRRTLTRPQRPRSTATCSAGRTRTGCPARRATSSRSWTASTRPGSPRAGRSAWLTYVSVEDADAAAARVARRRRDGDARAAGRDGPRPDRGVRRPRGRRRSRSGSRAGGPGSGVVNAPGQLELERPPHARPRRRGSLLRRRVRLGGGHDRLRRRMESTMFRLPGYGDFLAERDPGLRERHADPSVPPGLHRCGRPGSSRSPPDGPPRWHVTFSAADTDAVVARAAELGGEVVHRAVRRRPGAHGHAARPAGRRVQREHVRAGRRRLSRGGTRRGASTSGAAIGGGPAVTSSVMTTSGRVAMRAGARCCRASVRRRPRVR